MFASPHDKEEGGECEPHSCWVRDWVVTAIVRTRVTAVTQLSQPPYLLPVLPCRYSTVAASKPTVPTEQPNRRIEGRAITIRILGPHSASIFCLTLLAEMHTTVSCFFPFLFLAAFSLSPFMDRRNSGGEPGACSSRRLPDEERGMDESALGGNAGSMCVCVRASRS